MDTEEKEYLLQTTDTEQRKCFSWKRLASKRPKYIELAFFLYYVAHGGTTPLMEQYVHSEIQKQHEIYRSYLPYLNLKPGDLASIINEDTIKYESCSPSNSSPILDGLIEQSVQSKSSTWLMFLDLALTVPAVFSTLIICSNGDVNGRKLGLVLASVGLTLRTCMFILTIYLQLSPIFYLFGTFLDGVSGSTLTFFGSSCAYVADTSSVQERSFRFIILQTLNTFASASANIGIGYIIDKLGYNAAFWIITLIQIINTAYIVIGVPDSRKYSDTDTTKQPNVHPRRSSLMKIKDSTLLVTKRAILSFSVLTEKSEHNYGRVKLGLLLSAFLTTAIIALGISAVQTLFMLAPPICWNSILIGYWNAISSFINGAAGIIGLWILTKVLKDVTVAIIGSTSHMFGKIVFGLAKGPVMLYISIVVGMGTNVVFPLIRAIMSKIISPRKQGALFATIFSLETIMDVCSGVLMNAIYTATLNINSGIVFYVGAVFYGISTLFICGYYVVEHKTTNSVRKPELITERKIEKEIPKSHEEEIHQKSVSVLPN